MNALKRFVTAAALVSAVGAAVSIAQPERRDPAQPGTTPPSTQPTTPPVTPPTTTPPATRPGQPVTPPSTTPGRPDQPVTPPSRPDLTRPGQPGTPPSTTPPSPATPGRDTRDPGMTPRQPGTTDTTRRDTTITRDTTVTTVTRDQVDRVVVSWPVETRRFVTTHFETFGAPAAATGDFIVWQDAGPWEKVVVMNHAYDNPVIVGGPKEFMVTWLDMEVPAAKACDLMRFNPSIIVNQTANQVGVMASSQEMAFATFNLAHEIIQGSRTVEDAQRQLITVSRSIQQGNPDPLTRQLNFQAGGGMNDPSKRGVPFRDGGFNPPGNDRLNRPGTDPTAPGQPKTDPSAPPRRGP